MPSIPLQTKDRKESIEHRANRLELAERIIANPSDLDALIEFTANDEYLNRIFVEQRDEMERDLAMLRCKALQSIELPENLGQTIESQVITKLGYYVKI